MDKARKHVKCPSICTLMERQLVLYVCDLIFHVVEVMVPAIDFQRQESSAGSEKSLLCMLETVCERFWISAEYPGSTCSTDFRRLMNALDLKLDSLDESCHPAPERSWTGKAPQPACRDVNDPSTKIHRLH